jgi:hypothetical protein
MRKKLKNKSARTRMVVSVIAPLRQQLWRLRDSSGALAFEASKEAMRRGIAPL